MICKKCVFYPTAQNFLLVGPYFQRIIFQPQWPLPIEPIVWGLWPGLPIFLAIKNMPPHFSAHVYCDEMAGWIRILQLYPAPIPIKNTN